MILSRQTYYNTLGRPPLPSPSEYPAVKVIPDSCILFTKKNKVLSAECLKFLREHLSLRSLETLCSFKTLKLFSLKIEGFFKIIYDFHHHHVH